MNHTKLTNCNIIKDLLPSYLEDICTPDTKKAVKIHLEECGSCRNLADMMQQTDFISERTESVEIDYMKKVKRHFLKKSCYGILLAAFLLFCFYAFTKSNVSFPLPVTYLFLPCLLMATKLLFYPFTAKQSQDKIWKILTAFAILFTCYGIFLNLSCYMHAQNQIRNSYLPFHIKPEHLGPFIHAQLLAILLYLTALYLIGIYHTVCKKPVGFLHMNIWLTCSFILFHADRNLKILSDVSVSLQMFLNAVAISLFEGVLFFILSILLDRHIFHTDGQ